MKPSGETLTSKTRERLRNPRVVEGKPLRLAENIGEDFGKAIEAEITLFWNDIVREMKRAFRGTSYDVGMDASITSDARTRLNALREKWQVRFNDLARTAVNRMIERVDKNSLVTLNQSLKDVAEGLKISTAYSDQRLKDVIQASTQEAAQLIKRIPEQYLDQVQGEVMRSITSGRGMQDLVPFFTKKYEGDVKWARHVAMDQMRKARASIDQVRLQKFGCEEYTWRHSGGSRYPRKEHIAMSGNVYRWDDPPVIDSRSGERGHPGTAVFCRCFAVPRFNFAKGQED